MILSGLLIFTIIVVVHELGHYWAARRAGIHVEEFSIGMGPRILHFTKNDTIWSIKAFPLGGSCRMRGDEENPKEGTEPDPKSFTSASVGWRMVVIAGGAIMNFALALVLATLMSMFNASHDSTVSGFTEISPVQEAGLEIGDRIVQINGRNVNIHGDFTLEMMRADGSPIELVVERGGQRMNFTVIPFYLEDENRYLVGFVPGWRIGPFHAQTQTEADGSITYLDDFDWVYRLSFFGAIANGFHNTANTVQLTMFAVSTLFTEGLGGLMGPLGIVTTVGGSVEQSLATGGGMAALWSLMFFTFFLSVNLGILNLLPLPALDGGRLIFLFLEAIRRKPINPDKEGMVHFAGFVLIMVLTAVVLYNDIMRMIGA